MNVERINAAITYAIALFLAWLGDFSVKDLSSVFAMLIGACTFAVYWYYRRKTFQLLAAGKISAEEFERANR